MQYYNVQRFLNLLYTKLQSVLSFLAVNRVYTLVTLENVCYCLGATGAVDRPTSALLPTYAIIAIAIGCSVLVLLAFTYGFYKIRTRKKQAW